MLWGTGDKYLSLATAKGSGEFIDDLEEKYFEGVSHWIQMEIPNEVNAAMEQYLNSRKK